VAHNTNKGRRIASYGQPKLKARGIRPHVWTTGPDPIRHKQFRVWGQQKNQAQWRGESWHLDFETWLAVWELSGQWANRGRERGTYCMSRVDWEGSWSQDNVAIVTREAHAKMQGQARSLGIANPLARQRRHAHKGAQP
jgi:hypothetical protein